MTEQYSSGHSSSEQSSSLHQKPFQIGPHQQFVHYGDNINMTNGSTAAYGYDSPDCGYFEQDCPSQQDHQQHQYGRQTCPIQQTTLSPVSSVGEFPPAYVQQHSFSDAEFTPTAAGKNSAPTHLNLSSASDECHCAGSCAVMEETNNPFTPSFGPYWSDPTINNTLLFKYLAYHAANQTNNPVPPHQSLVGKEVVYPWMRDASSTTTTGTTTITGTAGKRPFHQGSLNIHYDPSGAVESLTSPVSPEPPISLSPGKI